jgi:hypothetical protein
MPRPSVRITGWLTLSHCSPRSMEIALTRTQMDADALGDRQAAPYPYRRADEAL